MAKKQQIDLSKIDKKYIDEYYNNEYDANRRITNALSFTAGILVIVWILYLIPGLFSITQNTRIVTCIALPIFILVLVSPQIWVRSPRGKKPGFKYFLLISLLLVFAMLNIIIPKHAIMGWAVAILVANHYYNPKVGRIVFIATLIVMMICIYLGMFFGEYDPNLLMGELDVKTDLIHTSYDTSLTFPDTPQGRLDYLRYLRDVTGHNRYITAVVYYYFPRSIVVIILHFVSNQLNKRTNRLMLKEISINSEQQKVSTELNVAKEIQLSSLPNQFVTTEDVEIMAELKAAKEVGGDFYDYFNLDDEHVAVVIGDVSGKGIPAAMFMMKTITCFKNFVSASKAPSQILKEVNKTIYEGNTNQMFVTCFLAIINVKTGVMKFSNAGHNPPIVGQIRNYRYLKCNPGFVLGGMPDAFVIDEEITLNNGDTLTLYTDGITEARNKEGAFYGEERLINFFNSKEFTCLVHLHHELKDDVALFTNGADQSDDMTYLTIKFHGDKYFYKEELFDGIKENIPVMLDFISEFAKEQNFDNSFKNNLLVVGDELISNIVKYGYPQKSGEVFIRLLYNSDKKIFIFTIIDSGIPFNQFDVNNSPISGDISNQKVGGLGILIVKNIMTEYAYDHLNNKNIITLRKKL